MTLSPPTAFAAHNPALFNPVVSTSFAAYEVASTDWADPWRRSSSWLAMETGVAEAMRQSARSMTAVFTDIGPALVPVLPRLDPSVLNEIAAVFRTALRDVVLGSTSAATSVRWVLETPVDVDVLADDQGVEIDEISPAFEDRRIYALASVKKLQRVLHLNQDEVALLVGISRPTIWNWQKGRTPQERSLRRLHDVTSAVDILIDRFGGEDGFDLAVAERGLGLADPVANVLFQPDGPQVVLDAIFSESRRESRGSLLPEASGLLTSEESGDQEMDGNAVADVGPRRRVRRRTAE